MNVAAIKQSTLQIDDDGDEITLFIGNVTHGHFNRFDLDGDEAAQAIGEAVVEFLGELFSDRIVVWKRSLSGGWSAVPDGLPPQPHGDAESHLWSRPLGG